MGRDPAILWYVNDWVGATMTFTRPHKGAYMDLLMAQHNNGHMSLQDIQVVLGSDFEIMWESKLKSKFVQDENGLYFNIKLEETLQKRRAFSESRKKNLQSKNTHMDSHMENENEDVNVIKEKEQKFKSEVYEFLKLYPDTILKEFISYWTEPNKSKTKMRYELQTTWDLARRLAKWANNSKDFKKVPQEKKIYRSSNFEETLNEKEITPGKIPDYIMNLAGKKTIKL